MTATTEETLSVSGILLSKTFGQQANVDRQVPGASTSELAALQIRQAMVGRWFFMIIGTIFSIMPAFVYWLAGTLAANGSPDAPTAGDDRRVHDAPEPAVLPARPAAQRPGRDPGLAGAVRPDLRVPRDGPRDRRRARRGRDGPTPRRAARSASATSSFQYPTEAVPSAGARGGRSRRLGRRGWPRRCCRGRRVSTTRDRPRRPRAMPAFGLDGRRLHGRAGRAGRPGRPVRGRARRRRPTSSRGCTTSTSGAVEIDDVDVRRIKLASLGEIIGVVTQETYLFHASVRDNLRYARPEATEEELETAARGRRDPRPDHGAARGLRHDRRRARLQAVGRREAAHRDRPGPAQGPAHPHPRRGDLGARHRLGAAHPGAPSSA